MKGDKRKAEGNFLKPQKCRKRDQKENYLSMFEIFCLRFPITSVHIFKIIDDQSLADCKGLSRTLRKFFDDEKFYWIRIIQKYLENQWEFSKSWKAVIHKTPTDTVKELTTAIQDFFKIRRKAKNKKTQILSIFNFSLWEI